MPAEDESDALNLDGEVTDYSDEKLIAIAKQREIILENKFLAVLEELSKKMPAEDESDALNLDGQMTDSETDV
ncbi:hypothetical protein AVEN_36641-1 [Araneus ventricosus]|uniref:Uncharacterized protein n=1 Tax=Araneus ventricosus TaxID=182803 RepID=A0A4Y2FY11_ARAVE|nr:hypothetical protein AVEN_36641-1 [Araneus ventricosus]